MIPCRSATAGTAQQPVQPQQPVQQPNSRIGAATGAAATGAGGRIAAGTGAGSGRGAAICCGAGTACGTTVGCGWTVGAGAAGAITEGSAGGCTGAGVPARAGARPAACCGGSAYAASHAQRQHRFKTLHGLFGHLQERHMCVGGLALQFLEHARPGQCLVVSEHTRRLRLPACPRCRRSICRGDGLYCR